jgi:hypothetical protein
LLSNKQREIAGQEGARNRRRQTLFFIEETTVDFIERIFGISPDGGSGTLEFLFFAVPVVGLYFIYRVRSNASKWKR